MRMLAFGVALLLHEGLLLGGGGLWRFELCMKKMEKREPAPSRGRGGGCWKKGSNAPTPPPSKFFREPKGVLPEPCAHRARTVRPFAYSVSTRSTMPESELP